MARRIRSGAGKTSIHTSGDRGSRRRGLTGMLVTAFSALLLLASGSASATIGSSLYDQNNNMDELGFPSTTLRGTVALADDFVVPAATSWQIGTIKTTGLDHGLTSVKVTIYSDSSNSPGTQVYTRTLSSGSFSEQPGPYPNWEGGKLTIPVDVTLASGHYWLSVQGDAPSNQPYFWESRDVVTNHAAMALDPTGFAGCSPSTSWTDLASCSLAPAGSLDLMFALYGPSIADTLIPTNGTALTATEGAVLTNRTLGTFTDDNPSAVAANFTGSVNWGDGTTTPGTVTGSDGNFTVTGSYIYRQAGDYNVVTTVSGNGGTAKIITIIHVADAPLTISQVSVGLKATRGVSTATLIVKFTDANSYATSSDYTPSTVNWGDNSAATTPTFATTTRGWSAAATHQYVRGSYKITITIEDKGGATAIATKTISVR